MRDTDQDLTSVVVVRDDAPYKDVADLKGETVGTGAIDSPQATLLPRSLIRERGLRPGGDVAVRRFDAGAGLHGDHIGGERDAARAMMAGDVAAACMVDANHLLFVREGTLPAGGTRVIGRTRPYDHCNMTATGTGPGTERFRDLLLSMRATDPAVRTLFDLEGLTAWRPGRTSGYAPLERAVEEDGFYDASGAITAPGYRP
ncbi:phosphate/phosphite/phosphonate ABC transporter substrate-binding protein [Actinomadura sp. NTSP31]|uniref:phosphate/phosphite/phosphonate ABC transporter substrate-binding protein n=1 Tax=Actinomadura sp. NTSP31 TaxID=1735447 RepID=UPI0035C0DE4B